MSNLQPNCCLKFVFQKVDQHAGGKWLIHDTKRRKDNQLQSLKLPCISRLIIRPHKVSMLHDLCLKWSDSSEVWQAFGSYDDSQSERKFKPQISHDKICYRETAPELRITTLSVAVSYTVEPD